MHHRLLLPLVYCVVVVVVLPCFTRDKVYSLFYREDADRAEQVENVKRDARRTGVEQYLSGVDAAQSMDFHTQKLSHRVDNLLVIIAKKPSHKEDYVLSQLVSEVDRNIRRETFYTNAFFICNATRINFPELDNLSKLYPVHQAHNTSKWRLLNKQEVAKHDFIDCIVQALEHTNATHVTVMRDLVVPYSGFLEPLNRIISTRLSGTIVQGELREQYRSWLFLHLHEPVPFRPYQLGNMDSILELALVWVIGGCLFSAIFSWVEGQRHSMFSPIRLTYTLFGSLLFLTFALVIGRPYVSELRRLAPELYQVYGPPEPVDFSALTLPQGSAVSLLEQLERVQCSVYFPFHRVLDQMVSQMELPGYVISPSLVRYVYRE